MKFADAHRNIEKYGIQLLKTIKPVSTGKNELYRHWIKRTQSFQRGKIIFML